MTKEEAIKILTGYMGGNIDPESTELYHAIELAVDILESKPSLPSDLDEAAIKIAYGVCKQLPNGTEKDSIVYYAILAAIAGAEWIAGQGYTFETIMQEDEVDELVPTCPDMYNHGYSDSDKVIVQIRKKH